ncbi:ferric-dicitrate binding protein FerR, regulates iron transport through sigma-19 [Arenibacter palladensis]|uniref:Ferric-dicitrate binding protein FerR, regulates iron transport through sigma-19 n=1 Tax=Arenibacter palladensis TaxID=237373 RepID=A0A1M5EAJ1_9FLAO|nr:FecR domain-containing protein [Arenibacter palladensis]SHF76215.1 ferric-dicitrate binding protein FerR, regulates iron transport through sigma-19 [Arenibacter palladensis]
MEKKEKKIERIIAKSFKGELDSKEQIFLDQWISLSQENKKKFGIYEKLWKRSGELLLSNTIDVEASLLKTKKRIPDFRFKRRTSFGNLRVAAAMILAMGLGFLFNYLLGANDLIDGTSGTVYQEVRASYGTRTKILLADGTNVWLNSGSTLKFPVSFDDAEERVVELNGEGYFDVTKNESKPFIVNTSGLDVKVYGTSFNVSAYEEYDSMEVALVEGKVSLVQGAKGSRKEYMVLNPNDVVECSISEKRLSRISDSKMSKYTAWKEGKIVFYGDPIDKVVSRLEKWYNVDIEISDKALENYRFTATFNDESLEQVLKLLSLSSPMEYKIVASEKMKDDSFSRRRVILSIKK